MDSSDQFPTVMISTEHWHWRKRLRSIAAAVILASVAMFAAASTAHAQAAAKKPNIVMLMEDDTGWNDFGVYHGGANLGHPTPNIDRLAKEGAMFTSWYGQASCTAD